MLKLLNFDIKVVILFIDLKEFLMLCFELICEHDLFFIVNGL